MTVTVSFAAAVVGFLPIDGFAIAQPQSYRVIATPVPAPVLVPVGMEIPKIGMQAPVVPVGTMSDGTMASPQGAVDVGWWQGRKPGEGNALFAAHVNWNGRQGSFSRLKELKPGDEIVVRGKDGAVKYRVVWVRNFDPNMDATELLGNESGGQIATLITCGGQFDRSIGHHTERVVARAVLSA